jgi:putative transposase
MILSQKTEFFPNVQQKEMLKRMFGFRRLIFNKALELLLDKYKDLKESKALIKKKELTEYRDTIFRDKDSFYYTLLKDIPNQVLDTALEDLHFTLQSLWRKGKLIRYRSKKSENTARLYRKNDSSFQYENSSKYLKVTKLGMLKLAEPLRWKDCNIKIVTFKYEAGRFFISLSAEINDKLKQSNSTGKHIGLDWGLKTFFTGFDGENVLEMDYDKDKLVKLDNRISKMQRNISRHNNNSNNYAKARTKLEQAYLNRTNYQRDEICKLASYLVTRYDYIVLEDLNLAFVFKNKKLSKKAGEKMFYTAKLIIVNKFNQHDKKVFSVDRQYPSTQICSSCGKIKVKDKKLKLSNRNYNCSCGLKIDRDENAARNIYHCPDKKELVL